LFYIPGILLGNILDNFDIGIYPILTLFSILIIGGFAIARWFSSYKKGWWTGVFFFTSIFLFGVFNSYNIAGDLAKVNLSKNTDIYIGEIVNDPIQTKKSIRLELATIGSGQQYDSISRFKVLAYLEKSPESSALVYGDKLVFESSLNKTKNSGNPDEFDYAGFLAFKGIVYTTYLNEKQWSFLLHSPSNKLIAFAKRLRHSLLIKLKEVSIFNNTYEVSAAILLGYDVLMDAETEQSFVSAGAMHILCVSGLHVGVVFMIISLLLNFLKINKLGNFIRIVLLLAAVWSYALLTGMSPSIQRASVMISFFIIGEGFSRLKDNYNTLAASAFVMLLVNPNLIYGVGFQLSYAAVIGIISLYRPVYNLFYVKNKVLDYLWSITAVSFAATLATFPIATHYFHYFPTYFWLTNLFIIPLSFLIIMIGFVFIIVSWVPYLSVLVGGATSVLVFMLNQIVDLVKWFPFHGFDNIYMPVIKIIMVYSIMVLIFHLFFFKKIKLLKYLVFIVLAILVFNTVEKYNRLKQRELFIYNVKNHDVLEFAEGRKSYIISDSIFLVDEKLQSFTLKENHIKKGLRICSHMDINKYNVVEEVGLLVDGNFIEFQNMKYFILKSNDSLFISNYNKRLEVDVVIIAGRESFDMEKLEDCLMFNKIIISSSVPYWKQKLILKNCKEVGIKCFSVLDDGAFVEGL